MKMKNPPSYARIAQMSGAELLRQLDLSQSEAVAGLNLPELDPRVNNHSPISSLAWAEIKLRIHGKRRKKVRKCP